MKCFRLEKFDEQLDDVQNTVGFKGGSGLAIRTLVDCQKLLACRIVADDDKIAGYLSPAEKTAIKVATSENDKFSGRINLVFRSNATLRTMPRIYWDMSCWSFGAFVA
jgi:hypothetical protein